MNSPLLKSLQRANQRQEESSKALSLISCEWKQWVGRKRELPCILFIFFIVKGVTLLVSKHNKEAKTRILIQQSRSCSTIRVQFYEHHLTSKVQQETLILQVVRVADWDALYSKQYSKLRVAQISTHRQSNSKLYFLPRVTPSTEQGKVIFCVWATSFSAWVLNHKITWLNGELNQYKLCI